MNLEILSEQANRIQAQYPSPTLVSASTLPLAFWTDAGQQTVEPLQHEQGQLPDFLVLNPPFLLPKEPLSCEGGILDSSEQNIRDRAFRANVFWRLQTSILSGFIDPDLLNGDVYYINSPTRTIQFRPDAMLQASLPQLERVDRYLATLQDQLNRVDPVTSSQSEDFEQFDSKTIATSRKLVGMLYPYLLKDIEEEEIPYVVPTPDGTILFNWLRRDKELSITVTHNILQVQRWTPLSSYESEGYWEIGLDKIREHFDWVTQ